MKLLLLGSIFYMSFAFSQSIKDDLEYERSKLFETPNKNSLNSSTIKDYEEVYLHDESLLIEETDNGLFADDYYTGKDNNHFFMSYQFSTNYEEANSVTSLEMGYQFKSSSFNEMWYTFILKRTIAQYNAIANELDASDDPNADANTTRVDREQTFTTFGAGVGYRFRALSDISSSDRFFETLYTTLNYSAHLDSSTSTKYNGFGMNMDYGLHYRATNTFYYGMKLSYNIMTMVREPQDEEKREDRSLVFGWTALAFELGYFY